MSAVVLKNIIKYYANGTVALNNINLTIESETMFVLAGPEGAGKTTVLKLISGMEKPDKGDILINGKSVLNISPKDREISLVPRNFTLFPQMTVEENLLYALKASKTEHETALQRIHETMELLHVSSLLSKMPEQLTAAEVLLVAVTRAVIKKPKILLLDDMTFGLAPNEKRDVLQRILSLQKKKQLTVVYAVEDPDAALFTGCKMAVLYDGTIQQVDTAKRIPEIPANLFVAGFLGKNHINLVDAAVDAGKKRLTFGKQSLPVPSRYTEVLSDLAKKDLVLGISPQAIRVKFTETDDAFQVCGKPEQDDFGNPVVLVDTVSFVVPSVEGVPYEECKRVYLSFEEDKIMLFNKETEQLL
jgi:ABC-type sugar transport system ATPase subunit